MPMAEPLVKPPLKEATCARRRYHRFDHEREGPWMVRIVDLMAVADRDAQRKCPTLPLFPNSNTAPTSNNSRQ
jgi:hypothetical protein